MQFLATRRRGCKSDRHRWASSVLPVPGGVKALVAEIIVGALARAIGLSVPEILLVDVDPVLATSRAGPGDPGADRGDRQGWNVGLDFLPGALAYDASFEVSAQLAALGSCGSTS